MTKVEAEIKNATILSKGLLYLYFAVTLEIAQKCEGSYGNPQQRGGEGKGGGRRSEVRKIFKTLTTNHPNRSGPKGRFT